MSIVSIGAQCGGPEAGLVGELKVPLYQALKRNLTSSHCLAIDEYAVVLRVDGSLDRFGPEGLARLRFAKAKRYITVDFQIPESAWQGKSVPELKRYIASAVTDSVGACVARLRKVRTVVNDLLFAQMEAACTEYLAPAT